MDFILSSTPPGAVELEQAWPPDQLLVKILLSETAEVPRLGWFYGLQTKEE
jgi:hypothetical protein